MSRDLARDLVRLYRVRDWLHFIPLPAAGWIAGDARSLSALAGGTIAWTFGLAYMSAVNQAFDDRLDRPGKNPVGARLTRRTALVWSLPAALGCLATSVVCVPSRWHVAAMLLVASTVYSAPPRLKRVPLVGTLWNVVLALPGLVMADAARAGHPSFNALACAFSLMLLASQLIHEAADRDDDQSGGVSTIAVVAGPRGALLAAALSLAALPPVAWWLACAMPHRALFTAALCLFAAPWSISLATRALRGDLRDLRALRMRYRYTAIAAGAAAFALSL